MSKQPISVADSSFGAARAWTEQEIGGPCNEQDSILTIQTGAAIVLQGNGERVGLVFMNVGTVDAWLGLTSAVAVNNGLYLPALGGITSMDVRDDFTLPSRAWYGVGVGSAATVYCLEVLRISKTTQGL